jgi:hypothetical protein
MPFAVPSYAGYFVSLFAATAAVVVFIFQGSYQSSYGTTVDLLTDVFAGGAFVSAGVSLARYEIGFGTRSGKVWWSFTVGIFLWFLGEITWSAYTYILKVPIPYPSVADVFYFSGYFPLFIGFYLYVTYFKQAFSRRISLVALVTILASASIVFVFLISPVLASSEAVLEKFFDFAYPLMDLLLLSTAIVGLGLLVRGRLGIAWLLFTAGILLNVFGDLLFSYSTIQGTYYNGSLPDLFFLEGYVAFGMAFFLHRKEL